MEFLMTIILAVLGAASIVGGIVGYCKSRTTLARAVSASAIAAGIVMWVIILFIPPITRVVGP